MTTPTPSGADVRAGELAGRRILVTGASSGIGAATARTLVERGARVGLLARRVDRLEALAEELGAAAVAVPADVVDVAAVRAGVEHAAEHLEGLDGVVNSAGLVRPGTVVDADPAQWRAMMEVNVLGLLHVTQAVVPQLVACGGGDVVNVSSMTGRRLATAELGVYAASKAGVHALSEGLRRELADRRIRVTVVAPGLVATELLDGLEDPVAERLRGRAEQVGLAPDDVARAIADVLAAPPHVLHVEVALLSATQER